MALKYIANEAGFINYLALSTDIDVDDKIPGAVAVGRLVYLTDTGVTKVILDDQSLVSYALPATFSGSIALGSVDINQTTPGTTNGVAAGISAVGADGFGNHVSILTAPGSVNSAPLATFPYGYNGSTWDKIRVPNINKDLNALAIGTITTVWTPGTGKRFRLIGGSISVSGAVSVLFEDNASGTTIFRTPKLLADTPYNFTCNGGQGILSSTANFVLKVTSSGAANITGTIWGVEE
jgi:hypothetical protein